jgi:hypothetical protein
VTIGAALSVTESIGIDAAKSATGDKFDQIKWGAVVKGGEVSAEDWNAAVKVVPEKSASERSVPGKAVIVPEIMAKQLKQRETWDAGRAKFYSWLAQTQEDALEPELEIVDPHHHVWDMRELCGYNLLDIFLQQYYGLT